MAPGIERGTFGIRSLEFILSTLALVAAVRRMLKIRVTLGNISGVLLNLNRILLNVIKICNVQRLLLPLNIHAVNIHSYFLFSSPFTSASHLNCSLALSVWLLS